MPDFGSFRGFGDKLVQGQTPTQLGLIGSFTNIIRKRIRTITMNNHGLCFMEEGF